MHTARTIGLIIGGALAVTIATWIAGIALLGWVAATVLVGAAVVVAAVVTRASRPWYRTWGATDGERDAAMPGDELLAAAAQSTRAINIGRPPAAVWPWLVQLGWGRAGWYSYDRIDNDGHQSATTIRHEWQHLEVGDAIAMTPTLGFTVRAIEPATTLVAQAPDGTSWCLHLTSDRDGCRLVSRFRAPHRAGSAGAALWALLADPGSFVMERRMLLTIKQNVEQHDVPESKVP